MSRAIQFLFVWLWALAMYWFYPTITSMIWSSKGDETVRNRTLSGRVYVVAATLVITLLMLRDVFLPLG